LGRKKERVETLKTVEGIRLKGLKNVMDTQQKVEEEGRMSPSDRHMYRGELNKRTDDLLRIRKEREELETKKGIKGLFVRSKR
jgi:hypothetical protein